MKKVLAFIGFATVIAGAVVGVLYLLKRHREEQEKDVFNFDEYDFDDFDCECDDCCDCECDCGCEEAAPAENAENE